MTYSLQIVVGTREVGSYEIAGEQELVIGRDDSNDIVVHDRSVSRRHCLARVAEDGVELVDLGSANGLYVGGKLLKRVLLQDGDQVNLGMARVCVTRSVNHTGMIPVMGLLETVAEPRKAPPDADVPVGDLDADFDSNVESSQGGLNLDPQADSLPSATSSISGRRPEYEALEKDRLAILIETGKTLGQSADLDQLLALIMDHLFQILPVKRAVVALTDDGGETFSARVCRPATEAAQMSSVASVGILRQVTTSRRGRIIEDASLDKKLKSNMSIVVSNIRAAVCVPIMVHSRCLGAIYCDYPGRARLYTSSDLDFLTAFASIAAVSIENSRMMRQLREDDRLKRDLEIAAEIQQGILPNEAFLFEGLEIDWAYWPSLHIGGDFYDVIDLKDGRIAVLLGDVSGKSVPAALYMARTLSFLRAAVTADQLPGAVMTRVNALLGDSGERVLFATTFLMVIDPRSREIEWSNAGHNPVLIRDPETGEVAQLDADGVPLGIDETWEYETHRTTVKPGSYITLYTDGLAEARDTAGVQFGLDRVNALVRQYIDEPVAKATQAMIEAIAKHSKDSKYRRDDVAILNIRVL